MAVEPVAGRALSREQLYELVWQTPITTLAPRHGLKPTELIKLCDRQNVPRPPAGYWTQLKFGTASPRPPLPPAEQPQPEPEAKVAEEPASPPEPAASAPPAVAELASLPKPAVRTFFDAHVAAAYAREEAEASPVVVREHVRQPHPLVARTRAAMAQAEPDKYGRVSPGWRDEKDCLDICVARPNLPRALRIMDALVWAAERRGYRFQPASHDRSGGQRLVAMGEQFMVRVFEPARCQPHVMTKAEIAEQKEWRWASFPSHDYTPQGRLELHLGHMYFLGEAPWRDGEVPLEQQLGLVFQEVLLRVDQARREQAEREERQRVQAEHARRMQKEAERHAREQAKVQRLLDQSARWQQATRIRAYIAAVRAQTARWPSLQMEGQSVEEWALWATGVADTIDP